MTKLQAFAGAALIGAMLGSGWLLRTAVIDTPPAIPGSMAEAAVASAETPLQARGRGSLLASASPQTSSGMAFVINSGEASISLVDVATRTELRRIPVLREPHHMALTPDHRFLIIGDTAANELLFLDPLTGDIAKRMPVSDPYQFGFSPDGKWFVVNGLLRNQIDIYDAATMQLTSRIPASGMPSHLNFSPDSKVAYVSLQSSNSLIAIDVAAGKPIWKAVVGPVPAGVLWHRGKLLVGIMGADYIAMVDPANGAVQRRIHTAKGAHVLFVPNDGKVIYATNRVDGSVVVLDADTLTEIRRFRVAGGPDDMDFAPDGKMWVTRRWAQSVAVIDPLTGVGQTFQTGRSPHGIWLNTHDKLIPAPALTTHLGATAAKPGA